MTNVEKYALLSKSVYLFGNLENWILVDKMNGDIINDTSETANKNIGFRAGLYICNATKEKVLAIAGADFLDIDQDVKIDTSVSRFVKQINNTKKFYSYLREKYPNETINTTGHSLGGACAAYITSKHGGEAHIFNAPQVDQLEEITLVETNATDRIHRYYIDAGSIKNFAPTNFDDENPLITNVVGGLLLGVFEGFFD